MCVDLWWRHACICNDMKAFKWKKMLRVISASYLKSKCNGFHLVLFTDKSLWVWVYILRVSKVKLLMEQHIEVKELCPCRLWCMSSMVHHTSSQSTIASIEYHNWQLNVGMSLYNTHIIKGQIFIVHIHRGQGTVSF